MSAESDTTERLSTHTRDVLSLSCDLAVSWRVPITGCVNILSLKFWIINLFVDQKQISLHLGDVLCVEQQEEVMKAPCTVSSKLLHPFVSV